MTDPTQTRTKQLIEAIHFFHGKGWAPATSTNYSFRLPGEPVIHITASGLDKGTIGPGDLLRVGLDGTPLDDPRRPSAETLLHTLIYRLVPDCSCVLHTHSVYSTVLSSIYHSEGHLRIAGLEVLKALEGFSTHEASLDLPIFGNSQDMEELSRRIEYYWHQRSAPKGFLLAGHGLYTWVEDIDAAKRQVEAIEFLLECHYKIHNFRIEP